MARPRPDVMLRIDGIEDETEHGVCVVLRGSGRRAWLPKEELDYLPGAVVVPGWLAKKMQGRDAGKGE